MLRTSEVGKEWGVVPPLYMSRVHRKGYVASRLNRCAVVNSGNCGLLHHVKEGLRAGQLF
jgi:hypothetical protein